MPGFSLYRTRPEKIPLIWIGLNAALLLCVGITFINYLGLKTHELQQANRLGQRAIVDAVSGEVSVATAPEKAPAAGFEVAPSESSVKLETPEAPITPKEPPAAEPLPEMPASSAAPALGAVALRTTPLTSTLPESLPNRAPLVPAPAPEISEKHGAHMLPKRNGSASPAMLYSQRFERNPEQHLLTFILTDVGVSPQSLPLIATLPKEITLAFSPYTQGVTEKIAQLRALEFEVWTMLPLASTHYPEDDPGPLGFTANISKATLFERLQTLLSATIGSVGFVLPPDEGFTTKPTLFSPVLMEVDRRGLRVISTHPAHSAKQVAGAVKLESPVKRAEIALTTSDAETLEHKLEGLEALFKTSPEVIVSLPATPATIGALQTWLKAHPAQAPVTLAPLSAHWLPKESPKLEPVEASGGHGGGHGAPKPEKKPEKKEAKPSGHGAAAKKPSGGGHH